MERNKLSTRSIKWINRYSLNNPICVENVLSMCECIFSFITFKIGEYKGENALWLTYGTKSYIAYISTEKVCIEVLEKNINSISDNHYHKIEKIFFGESCWYNFLFWVKNRI